mmetsp:Transcript_22853/g.32222  ORF Transcript_22853/g.32222 Transcript_22853/m.32222 type:complete len:144 (-) Transcript_22853:357-788(-)
MKDIVRGSTNIDILFSTSYYNKEKSNAGGEKIESDETNVNVNVNVTEMTNQVEAFPLMKKFGLPLNDTETMNSLLREIVNWKQKNDAGKKLPSNSFAIDNPHNKKQSHLYIHVPNGMSKSSKRNFSNTVTEMIMWRASGFKEQ